MSDLLVEQGEDDLQSENLLRIEERLIETEERLIEIEISLKLLDEQIQRHLKMSLALDKSGQKLANE